MINVSGSRDDIKQQFYLHMADYGTIGVVHWCGTNLLTLILFVKQVAITLLVVYVWQQTNL